MSKGILLRLDEKVLEKLDEEWQRIGFPSRTSYVEQCIRRQLGLPNAFDKGDDEA